MKIKKQMYKNITDNSSFDVLQIYNLNKIGNLYCYYEFIRKNINKLNGDILEAGCYTGASLISTAILLKKLKSKKIVYGYDTFSGFPKKYKDDPLDKFKNWKYLLKKKKITDEHYNKIKLNLELTKFRSKKKSIDSFNISSSLDFSNNSIKKLKKKIKFLKLDNIKLIKGSFEKTMIPNTGPKKIMCALIDADLYESYKISLPFVWSKLEKKGLIYLDEYYSIKFPGPRIATDEFYLDKNQKPKILSKNKFDFERWGIFK